MTLDTARRARWDRAIPAALFLVAVGLRVLALVVLGLGPEPFEYEDLALSLLAGHGYQRSYLSVMHYSQGPPFYPFFAAGVYALTSHSQTALVVTQIVASSLVPVVIYWIGRSLGCSRPVGALAATGSVVHPGLIVYAVRKLHPLTFDALLIAVVVLVGLRLADTHRRGSFFFGGVALGVAALSRPTIVVFGAIIAAWLVVRGLRQGRDGRGDLGLRVACFVVGAALVMSPWVIRNYAVHGRIVFVTTDTAELFWRGNHPGATGSAYATDGRPILAAAPDAFQRAVGKHDELGQYDLFFAAAREFVRTQPRAFLRLLVTKWTSFWWFPETAGRLYPGAWLRLYKAFYAGLLAAFVVGLVVSCVRPPGRPGLLLVVLALLSVSLAQSLFYVEIRHRWGVEPIMGVLAAYGLGVVATTIRARASGKAAASQAVKAG